MAASGLLCVLVVLRLVAGQGGATQVPAPERLATTQPPAAERTADSNWDAHAEPTSMSMTESDLDAWRAQVERGIEAATEACGVSVLTSCLGDQCAVAIETTTLARMQVVMRKPGLVLEELAISLLDAPRSISTCGQATNAVSKLTMWNGLTEREGVQCVALQPRSDPVVHTMEHKESSLCDALLDAWE